MRVLNQKITDFLSTLKLGLSWIGDAGKKLVKILDEDPNAFEDIIAESNSEWLTRDVLLTIEAIGRGTIAPETLILPLHVLERLTHLPTDEQVRAMRGVDVMVPPGSRASRRCGYHKTHKPACKLTPAEAKRVLGPNGIRTYEEQIADREARIGDPMGKYQVVMELGQEPRLTRLLNGGIPDYQKQRVKLVNGCALVEFYS